MYCSSFGARKSKPTSSTFLFDSPIDRDKFTAVKDLPSLATDDVTKIEPVIDKPFGLVVL